MDQFVGLQVFREVVECGSFAAAAERLSMSAPMVSKHIAQLERRLGARLLNRNSRHLSLTEAGTLYHAQCRQALDVLDAAAAAVGRGNIAPRGELKVSAPVWCATGRFARILADYRTACPQVTVDLHLENRMVDLASEGYDVALRATAEPSPALFARRLCTIDFHLVGTPGCVQRHRRTAGTGDLPWPAVVPNYLQHDRLYAAASVRQSALRIEAVMRSSDTTLSYHAVRTGMGVAWLPHWMIEDDLARRQLVHVSAPDAPMRVPLFAVYTSRKHMPPKLRSFIDFMITAMDDVASPG